MTGPIQRLDSFFQRVRVRHLGLGLLVAWVYCSWFSSAFFDAADVGVASDTLKASLLFSALGFVAVMARPKKRAPLPSKVVFASGVVVSATAFLFLLSSDAALLFWASALGGFASAVLWVSWGELYCRMGRESAESCIPASLAAFVASSALICLVPDPIAGIASALLPLVSCIMVLLGENPLPNDFEFPVPTKPLARVAPSLLGLALCAAACSMATGFVTASIAPDELGAFACGPLAFYVAGGFVSAIAAPLVISHARKVNFSSLYEWIAPLVVFSLSCRAFGNEAFDLAAFALACIASLSAEVAFYVVFVDITVRGLCLPSGAFGVFRSVVQLGFLVGGAFGQWAAGSETSASGACLVLICACVVVSPLFRHLQERFDRPSPGWGGADESEACGKEEADAFADISRKYKLSARESEVLGYLGRGRSVPYMRDVMTISKSTIETHIKHIYAKTGVHSKQELLDLVEEHRL